jgi:hypothetical protein
MYRLLKIMIKAVVTIVVTKTVMEMMIKAVVMVVAIKTVVEMITVTILDIGQRPAMIIIRMSISIIIDITVIGIHGIRGNSIKETTPIMSDMAIMKDIITNCFSCSMMV